MTRRVQIASRANLPATGVVRCAAAGLAIALCITPTELLAVADRCTHDDAALSDGWFDEDDLTIECPLHGSRFDARSGRPLNLPAFQPVMTYPVIIEGNDVFVLLP